MRAKEGLAHLVFTWLVIGLALLLLWHYYPAIDFSWERELLAIILLVVLAELLAVPFPNGRLSGAFTLVLAAFIIYGPAAAAWINGLAVLFGQVIARQGNPARTVLFNAGQYVLTVAAAAGAFHYAGGDVAGRLDLANAFPLAAFTVVYFSVNHLLVFLYLIPKKRLAPQLSWLDVLKWDGLTYLFAGPLGLLIVYIYGQAGLTGAAVLFSAVLSLQVIFRYYVRLQIANRELKMFYELALFLQENQGPVSVLEQILKSARRLFPYHSGVAYLRTGSTDSYLPVASTGVYAEQLRSTLVYIGEGIIGRSMASMQAEIIHDSRSDHRTTDEPGLCQVMRSLMVVPITTEPEAVGVLVFGDKRPGVFNENHMHIISVLAGQAAIIVENHNLKNRQKIFVKE